MIDNFTALKEGKNIEYYLKNHAWDEDSSGATSVYLIKDNTDQIVFFFSLRCGLLFEEDQYKKLTDDEKYFVNSFMEDIKNSTVTTNEFANLYDACSSEFSVDKADKLLELAGKLVSRKQDESQIKEKNNIINVDQCHAAIELQFICKNINCNFKSPYGIPVSFGIFWERIVPLIFDIQKKIGCEYIYLFAADNPDKDPKTNTKHLVTYYKQDLKFSDPTNVSLLKPQYDVDCFSLIQEINELEKNREIAWQSFADIVE